MLFDNYLFNGERVIHESKAPHVMINKGSSSRNYSLAITNKGRIIALDTGGVFGEEKVYYFHGARNNYKIKVELLEDMLQMVGETIDFKFNLKLNLLEFFRICNFVGEHAFRLNNDQIKNCYIIDEGSNLYLAEYLTNDQGINFKFKEKPYKYMNIFLDFGKIESFDEEKNNILKIKGKLNLLDSSAENLLVYVPHSPSKEKIVSLINNANSIYRIANTNERITSANLKCQLSEGRSIDYDVYILDDNSHIRIFLQNSLDPLLTKKKEEIQEYYNKQLNQNVLGIEGDYFFIIPNYTDSKESIQFKNQNFSEFIYIENIGVINGVLNGLSFFQKKVDLALSPQQISFIDHETKLSLLTFKNKLHKYLVDENLLFILDEEEVIKLELNRDRNVFKNLLLIEEYTDQEILLDLNEFPYYFKQTSQGLKLYNGREKEFEHLLKNEHIQDIKITLNNYSKSFKLAEFTGRSKQNEKNQYYIPINLLNVIIQSSFIASKAPKLVETNPSILYKSMVRQISDLILYEYFGQLVALYEGIDKFYEQDIPEEERTAGLVSYLYYGIQSQRKRMDYVSIYLPGVLHKLEEDLFRSLGKGINDRYFKQLQQQLIGISNQMKGSLLEIENNLTHLGILIPKRSAKELIDERRKSGYKTAGLGMAVGLVLTAVTAGGVAPILLAPAFMALNTKNSVKTMQLQEEIRTENEQNRTKFYLLKALDSFEHFIQTMMPYYISKVNEIIFECYKKAAVEYKPLLDEVETKQAMLHRIGEIYTYKKLPVDRSVEVSRQDLLNCIFETAEAGNQYIETYENNIKITSNLPVTIDK
ncbi:hypothetical protein ND894_19185 [Priestia megaterium]|uniref:hypothetical protein n=1 Tax=Priestia megaterium TaxID=1404 RepID=UPI002076A0B1|nr:hypothetical protein [Priestia megaterium]USD14096.1 hypothetical protein ND894_19185 [Priestia megaterium]